MNQKNSLGLNICFLDLDDPIHLFHNWMEEAKKTEPNDPNAVALATSNKNNVPSVRMVLLKDFNQNGFVFYTNLDSQKGHELKQNPNVAMCFHWKSLLRQIELMAQFHWCPMRLQMITIIQEVMKAELEHGHLNRVKN